MSIKLPKLPERTPVKVSISLGPELYRTVLDYIELHRETHGMTEAEPITEILPFIVREYLESDKGFAKARKARESESRKQAPPTRKSA
jgi:hypothetical protein